MKQTKQAPRQYREEPTQQIVKKGDNPLAAQVPGYLQHPSGTQLAGFEEFEQSDVKMPRLSLCQSLTPQREQSDPRYIEGLSEGDFFNNVTQVNYGKAARIIPLLYFKMRLRFRAMDEGGGILCRSNDCRTGVGDPGSERGPNGCLACPQAQFGTARNGEGKGTDCLLIYNFPVLVANDEGRFSIDGLSVLSLKSTAIPVAQEWIVKMRFRKTDMFAGIYTIKSSLRNEGKLKWYVPVIENAGFIPEALKRDAQFAYQAMRDLRDQGRLKVDEKAEEEELGGDANEDAKPPF